MPEGYDGLGGGMLLEDDEELRQRKADELQQQTQTPPPTVAPPPTAPPKTVASVPDDSYREGSAWKSDERNAEEEARDAAEAGGQAPPPAAGPAVIPAATAGGTMPSAGNEPQLEGLPGGPDPYTSDTGPQDAMLETLMGRMQQSTVIDPDDPNIKQQVDPFAAAMERQKRSAMSDAAESTGPMASGALRGQNRMLSERAGQQQGMFEAELVGRELQNRRDEIQSALSQLGGVVDSDQARQLQRELANLDAKLKTMGIKSAEGLGYAELSLRDRLGTGGLNIDAMNLMQRDRQFGDRLGFDVADREAFYNSSALRDIMG